VTGNGTYLAAFTLPTSGTVAVEYIWTASYLGDANNNQESSSLEPVLVGSVPDPSTWMMMGLGFAGLGFVAFRRSETRDASTALV
jgi:PEP-CTERM motif